MIYLCIFTFVVIPIRESKNGEIKSCQNLAVLNWDLYEALVASGKTSAIIVRISQKVQALEQGMTELKVISVTSVLDH